jgi:hypothetical protein
LLEETFRLQLQTVFIGSRLSSATFSGCYLLFVVVLIILRNRLDFLLCLLWSSLFLVLFVCPSVCLSLLAWGMARTIAVETPDVFRRYEIVLLIVLIIRHSSAIPFAFKL